MCKTHLSEVLICGAGAAGLTLAIDLARRGIRCRVIDRLEQPFHGSRGKGIQPRTLEVFEDLGIVDHIAAAGGPYPPQREHHHDGSHTDSNVVEPATPTPAEPYALPLMVPQFLTEQVMRDRLRELGGEVEYGRELTGFEQDAEGVTAQVSGPAGIEAIRARYLVGADGGRSFVRQKLDIGFPGHTLRVRAVVADLDLSGLDRNFWHRFNDGDMQRQLALCPLAGTKLIQLQAPVPLEGDVDTSAAGLERLVRERSGRNDLRVNAVTWASAYHMNERLADCYRLQRVFLTGDAAHVHPPTGGQGLNTSVQDAYNLGWKLAATLNGAPDSLLDSYEEERRPIAAEMLGLSRKLFEAHKRGETRRGRETRQLDLAYLESSLSLEVSPRPRALLAGQRAPNAPLRGAAGAPTRLFELFKGGHWTLLCDERAPPGVRPRRGLHSHIVGAAGDLIDEGGHFRAGYDLSPGESALVRPDGYIGAIFSSEPAEALTNYLRMVGLGENA
jgi:2-polyprenyl-6-methoxyphenol hydroxylase-like FAD-dependent oxidoreductase